MKIEEDLKKLSLEELSELYLNANLSSMIYEESVTDLDVLINETLKSEQKLQISSIDKTEELVKQSNYNTLFEIFPLSYSDFNLNDTSQFNFFGRRDALTTMENFLFNEINVDPKNNVLKANFLIDYEKNTQSKPTECSLVFKEGRIYVGEKPSFGKTAYRSCIGIASSKTNGKNVLHISFRGTDQNALEVFLKDYKNFNSQYKMLQPAIALIMMNLEFSNYDEIHITGHSMGASLASICYSQFSAMNFTNYKKEPITCKCFTFASPGIKKQDSENICSYNKNNKIYTINETLDLVPKISKLTYLAGPNPLLLKNSNPNLSTTKFLTNLLTTRTKKHSMKEYMMTISEHISEILQQAVQNKLPIPSYLQRIFYTQNNNPLPKKSINYEEIIKPLSKEKALDTIKSMQHKNPKTKKIDRNNF